MIASKLAVGGRALNVVSANTVVVGTGAAGYCAADRLAMFGQSDVVLVTDKVRAGASRNAGSDKQTYYKLTLSGAEPDSVRDLAATLFAGGAMHGDIALAEAALSARCFFHLVESGVPFPHAGSGEYVGYKTDHDPRQRATSVGPFTSKTMVEALEARVRERRTPVLDNCRVLDLVVQDGVVLGLLCLRTDVPAGGAERFLLLRCTNVIYATGGPAGMYADSVYPHGQWGATGAALRAGVRGANLTEWQFGLASVKPRWNVSGSYMQVLPRFVSTDSDGGDEREFLTEHLPDEGHQLSMIFLKGYQWPFDIRKARTGSSIIDLLVYAERVLKRRRVFLDFRRNPLRDELDITQLSEEARSYLQRAGALDQTGTTPIDRLMRLNRPAYDFYRERNPGVDLATDLLEITVSAQHNNGGLVVDAWWQSNITGFFPVGEAAGAHGVYRPGGAALNSGQVGATRAAQYVSANRRQDPVDEAAFAQASAPIVEAALELLERATHRHDKQPDTTDRSLHAAGALMSRHAGLVRSRTSVAQALEQVTAWLHGYADEIVVDAASRRSVDRLFLLRDILTSQVVYLAAMADYLEHGGRSRGSVLYTDPSGQLPRTSDGETELDLPDVFRFRLDGGELDAVVQEADGSGDGTPTFTWRSVRPLPAEDSVFENVWRGYRAHKNITEGVRDV